MGSGLSLEAFGAADNTDPGPSPDYQGGYSAGYAAATDAALRAAGQLEKELVQSLMDITFTYREAQQDVLASLNGLVTALTESILPHCVEQGFAQQIADMILTRCVDPISDAVTIHVHPTQVHAVQTAIANIAAIVMVTADPTLARHAAWIGQAQVETHLDMDRHLADISALLVTISHVNRKATTNG